MKRFRSAMLSALHEEAVRQKFVSEMRGSGLIMLHCPKCNVGVIMSTTQTDQSGFYRQKVAMLRKHGFDSGLHKVTECKNVR